MASRTASSNQRAASSSQQTHHGQQTNSSQAQSSRSILSQTFSRRPTAATSRLRQPRAAQEAALPPTRPQVVDLTAPTPGDGTDERDTASESDSDIIITRPLALCTGSSFDRLPNLPAQESWPADPNAQAMADALRHQRTTGTNTDGAQGPTVAGSAAAGEDVTTELIQMYRRRERDREQVDQDEVKTALWESLRRRVKSLDEDKWMWEVEYDGDGDLG